MLALPTDSSPAVHSCSVPRLPPLLALYSPSLPRRTGLHAAHPEPSGGHQRSENSTEEAPVAPHRFHNRRGGRWRSSSDFRSNCRGTTHSSTAILNSQRESFCELLPAFFFFLFCSCISSSSERPHRTVGSQSGRGR